MSAKPITAQEMVASIWKTIEDIASEYPEEDREELKAAMLGQLGASLFKGPVQEKSK